jgi:starch phosphorylase
VLELGGEDDPQRFNMAHLGLRLAQYANGVAKLHGAVSRGMFQDLYPNYDVDEVPITSITNGVHVPTWTRGPIKTIVASMAGGRDVATADRWENADAVGSAELWRIRNELRRELVERSRDAALVAWEQRGAQQAELGWTKQILNPEALTIGFARRVSTYKRLTLMLQQPERLRRILLDPDRPVQFVIAGKAHPNDMEGKQLLQQIVQFADDAGVRDHIVFIPDYNISLGKYLVAGSDVWLNNPIRPQEASGTSGMKAVMNGCLTMSISDGWWDELASDEVGWTIPTASTGDPHQRDAWEAQALYDILEHQVVPMFYDRDAQGIPHAWVDKVRRSMSQVGPQVAAERMVRDYVRELYLPAGRTARLAADLDSCGAFADWQQRVRDGWHGVAVTDVRNESGTIVAGDVARISAQVELGALEPSDVLVEAIAGRVGADGELIAPQRRAMTRNSSR